MKYKILFIDEEKDQHDNFLDYMDKIEDKVEVKCLYPEENIEAMIQVFEDEHPDAIVTDHQLNEIKTEIQYNVSYNGAELVNAYRDIRPNFPCFVITSYDNDAISTSKDVNLVYVKILMNGGEEGAKAKFHDKMVEQIDKYKKSIDEAQSELTSLVQKKQDKGLTLHEEDIISSRVPRCPAGGPALRETPDRSWTCPGRTRISTGASFSPSASVIPLRMTSRARSDTPPRMST